MVSIISCRMWLRLFVSVDCRGVIVVLLLYFLFGV